MAQSNTVNSSAPTSTSLSPEMKAWIESLCGYGKSLGMRKALSKVSASWSYPSSNPTNPFGGGTGTQTDPYLTRWLN